MAKLKLILLEEIIPAVIVLAGFFGSIWVFENYFSHLLR